MVWFSSAKEAKSATVKTPSVLRKNWSPLKFISTLSKVHIDTVSKAGMHNYFTQGRECISEKNMLVDTSYLKSTHPNFVNPTKWNCQVWTLGVNRLKHNLDIGATDYQQKLRFKLPRIKLEGLGNVNFTLWTPMNPERGTAKTTPSSPL